MSTPTPNLEFSTFAEVYENQLVQPLFRPFAERLISLVQPREGDRVLDVACGTGIVARLAKERVGEEGSVVGIDLNPQMIAVARARDSRIDWRQGNAEALPVRAEESFDIVTCHQGLQFFPDRAAALREIRQVLKDGGRLAAGTWRPFSEMPLLVALHGVVNVT
jgi:ubiquinone/menaquinone biosynthesis C-methylase UbiE